MNYETIEIVIIQYPNGNTTAYRRDDPALLDILIYEHDIIEEVTTAELHNPKQETKDNE
jgi:hypothetical protein